MRQKHRVLYGFVLTGLIISWGAAVAVRAENDHSPSPSQVAFAQQVSDLMVNELVAALFTEFDETTPANVEHGKQAISLIFNDQNRNMRLIGAFAPLQGGNNDRPAGNFERTALSMALDGGQAYDALQKQGATWFYKRSIPLSNTFHPNCVLCHTNFTPEFFTSTGNTGEWVGALVLSVPIQ